MFVPNVLVSDPDDMAHELADGVLEACDWPHHFGNRVNLGSMSRKFLIGSTPLNEANPFSHLGV